ncbi:MAG: AraC family transcriptional regulator [Proteobacteria bacterium]|nr:AraC family transcriptional regulator [Pseudomonadota bacterium]
MAIPVTMENATISVAPIRMWFEGLLQMGLDRSVLEEKSGIDSAKLLIPDERLPIALSQKLLEVAIELTGNENLALQMAANIKAENMGLVGHMMMNCDNLKAAGETLVRYWRLLSEAIMWEINEDENKNEHFIYVPAPIPSSASCSIESNLAASITVMRQLVAQDFTPVEICFQYSRPENIQWYEEVFRAPLKFNQPVNSIVLSPQQTKLKIPSRQDYLEKILKQHAHDVLKKMDEELLLVNQVQKLIVQSMSKGMVDVEGVSQSLNMSRWTLTRKLKGEGTSFQDIHLGIRRDMAKSYLVSPNYSVGEVAFLLGYSEPSAFQRAFKSWNGLTPAEYRKVNA